MKVLLGHGLPSFLVPLIFFFKQVNKKHGRIQIKWKQTESGFRHTAESLNEKLKNALFRCGLSVFLLPKYLLINKAGLRGFCSHDPPLPPFVLPARWALFDKLW